MPERKKEEEEDEERGREGGRGCRMKMHSCLITASLF